MAFKAREFVIDQEDIFKNDRLSRIEEVKNLSLLLTNITAPIVLSVNAPWGTGKTAFLKMLHAHIESTGSSAIYFSAWETDFANDPLLAFLGEMNEEVSKIINGNSRKQDAWNRAKQAGSYIVNKVPTALEALPVVGDLAGEMAGDIIDRYVKNKSEIERFKTNIKSLLTDKKGKHQKLYVFIDELDRCRPTYAIEFFERIKHILDIEGVVFVLAMDKEQLSHSVKAIYGDDFESIGYLKRFIDIEYILIKPELDKFIDQLYDTFGFNAFFEARSKFKEFEHDASHLKSVFKVIANAKNYSLRDIEQLMARINLVILTTKENVYLYPALLTLLLATKESDPEVYQDYINPKSMPNKMINHFHHLVPEQERLGSFSCALIEAQILGPKEENTGNIYEQHIANVRNKSTDDPARKYSADIVWLVENSHEGRLGFVDLKHLVSRIELIEKFNFSEEE
ncbi:hypothetical protein GCM10025856_03460 [Methylophaga marina]|uniref:KAP NTPase domain-containing protein n=1 Tax=Methylophaga marina TaxID=45495 RepID=A0ABN0TE77_9GAMM|nr:P-loop NTPase fold protein [Methylophaga marina]BDZ72627.1 hypothetical protein GCM10025856_03460 [Methylophaga marina]